MQPKKQLKVQYIGIFEEINFLKEGQKIRAWVDPPPLIQAMPERKRLFSIEAFPYACGSAVGIIKIGPTVAK